MSDDKFTCAECGRTFIKGRPDAEALQESAELFGELPPEERAVVCDGCFKNIMASLTDGFKGLGVPLN